MTFFKKHFQNRIFFKKISFLQKLFKKKKKIKTKSYEVDLTFQIKMLLNNLCDCFNNFIFEERDKSVVDMLVGIQVKLMHIIHMKRDKLRDYNVTCQTSYQIFSILQASFIQ